MSAPSKPRFAERVRRVRATLWRSRALRFLAVVVTVLCVSVQALAWGRAGISAGSAISSLSPSGDGFASYSSVLAAFGRQYVRRDVRLTLEDAFAERHRAEPRRSFVLGETGLRTGGTLWPHASHQRGLSVDVFVPLVDAARAPIQLSHQPWNLWGYCRHFDETGRYAGTRWEAAPRRVPLLGRVSPCPTSSEASLTRIDFDATARLLSAIHRAARAHGLEVRAIILAPEYLPRLFGAAGGRELGPLAAKFVRHPVWVRHDEHLHIEFAAVH